MPSAAPFHVVVASHALPSHRHGGLEQATAATICGLAARGHRVTVLTTATAGGGAPTIEFERVNVVTLPGRSGHPSPRFWRAVAAYVSTMRRAVSASVGAAHPVVYAVDMAGASLESPFVLQLHGTLFSETTLDRGFSMWRRDFPLPRAVWRYRSRLAAWPVYRRMLRRASVILADSEFIGTRLRSEGAAASERVRVVPLALDPARAALLRGKGAARDDGTLASAAPTAGAEGSYTAERPLRLLTVGRLARIKGHDVVAAALTRLAKEDSSGSPAFAWSVVGPTSWIGADAPPALRGLASASWVRTLGAVADDDLASLLQSQDLLLNLEFNQPAFGLVALEAMTAGCCPIVSDRGALPEVLGEPVLDASARDPAVGWERRRGGFVVPCGNADSLATLLGSIIAAGPAAVLPLRASALARAAEFSHERWIDGIEAALREVAPAER